MDGAVVADIGGTNARFAWIGPDGRPAGERSLRVAEYSGLIPALEAFSEGRPVRAACVAMACPVEDEEVRLTNADFSFTKTAVRQRFGLVRFDVINDFTAQALALPYLAADEAVTIGPEVTAAPGLPLAVLGPGTGLGVSGLLPVGARWVPISGEGGHVSFAPRTAEECAILMVLTDRFGRVSVERLLSGQGLVDLHTARAEIAGRPVPTDPAAAEITAAALAGEPFARATIDAFLGILGGLAGDLALTIGAFGGVYIAGGIVPRVRPLLEDSPFRARFEDKGRMGRLLARVPTRLVVAPWPALVGCAARLADAGAPA